MVRFAVVSFRKAGIIAILLVVAVAPASDAGRRRRVPFAPLLQTGQTRCYDELGSEISCKGTGQDGELRAGIAPDYADNGDGTITDRSTGLMWEKQSDDGSIHDRDLRDRFVGDKIPELNAAAFAGHTDWRVPNVRELESIRDYGHPRDVIAHAFLGACRAGCTVTTCSCFQRAFYWSSTLTARDPFDAWLVGFRFGREFLAGRFSSYATRAVRRDPRVRPKARPLRTGQRRCYEVDPIRFDPVEVACAGTGQDGEYRAGGRRVFVDNGDGTTTDRATGLMWETLSRDGSIHDVDGRYTWTEAFTVKIAALNDARFAGHDDWRVPNVRELGSLTHFGRHSPAVHSAFDRECRAGCSSSECSCAGDSIWSSTSFERVPRSAWFAEIDYNGAVHPTGFKSDQRGVRAVRTAMEPLR
jgi:hypothetical protein